MMGRLGEGGGTGDEGGDVALAGPHTCCWIGSYRGAHALAGLRVPGGAVLIIFDFWCKYICTGKHLKWNRSRYLQRRNCCSCSPARPCTSQRSACIPDQCPGVALALLVFHNPSLRQQIQGMKVSTRQNHASCKFCRLLVFNWGCW